jgi:putative oxidoreductase
MKDMFKNNHWVKDLGLDLIRIYLGIGLIIKAVFFMNHSDYLLKMMDSMGSTRFAPAILDHYVILAHFCGGVCLLLGLFTRTAAVIQLPILMGALFIHTQLLQASVDARQSAEFAGLVLFLLVLISIYGGGRWSLDYYLEKKQKAQLLETNPQAPKAV